MCALFETSAASNNTRALDTMSSPRTPSPIQTLPTQPSPQKTLAHPNLAHPTPSPKKNLAHPNLTHPTLPTQPSQQKTLAHTALPTQPSQQKTLAQTLASENPHILAQPTLAHVAPAHPWHIPSHSSTLSRVAYRPIPQQLRCVSSLCNSTCFTSQNAQV